MNDVQNDAHADLVLRNATVWTVDGDLPSADAVAIRGNEFVAVGRGGDLEPLTGPSTSVYDLEGKLVLPGFNDCHTHLLLYTIMAAIAFNLYGVDSMGEAQDRLAQNARLRPDSDWLYGFRWSTHFFEGEWPTRAQLDVVEDTRPVAIFDIDFHTAWVNTPALQRLGYDAGTLDPEGGTIVRDSNGYPTGILFENAHAPIPLPSQPSDELLARWLVQEAKRLNQLGITSISNMESRLENIDLTSRLAKAGRLDLRINHWPELPAGLDQAKRAQGICRGSEQVRVVGLKAFMDGVISNRTAWLLEPYGDAPHESGYPIGDPDELAEQVLEADRDGFQVVIHAIGDRAVREVLDAYERAGQVNGRRDSRHRIEHAELVHPTDFRRFAALDVVASMMPAHCCAPSTDGYARARIGRRREEFAYAWRSLVDLGAHLCFGTDWGDIELEEPDPLKQIYAAATRVPPQVAGGEPMPHPELCLSVEEAIRSYTLESAYAEFMEHRKGSITPGKLADMCVLSEDILGVDPQQILEAKVIMTVFDGKVVFDER